MGCLPPSPSPSEDPIQNQLGDCPGGGCLLSILYQLCVVLDFASGGFTCMKSTRKREVLPFVPRKHADEESHRLLLASCWYGDALEFDRVLVMWTTVHRSLFMGFPEVRNPSSGALSTSSRALVGA